MAEVQWESDPRWRVGLVMSRQARRLPYREPRLRHLLIALRPAAVYLHLTDEIARAQFSWILFGQLVFLVNVHLRQIFSRRQSWVPLDFLGPRGAARRDGGQVLLPELSFAKDQPIAGGPAVGRPGLLRRVPAIEVRAEH